MRPHFKRYLDYVMSAPKMSRRDYRTLILNTLRHVYADSLRDKAHEFVDQAGRIRNRIWKKQA